MELKIMEWNIKGSASLSWYREFEKFPEIVDKIIEQDMDIIVLVEFVVAKGYEYLQNKLQENGYIWFLNYQSGKNGVLICVKKSLIVEDDENNLKDFVKAIYKGNTVESGNIGCNFLKINNIPLKNNKKLSILGCRMETGGEDNLQKQYNDEREVFNKVVIPLVKQQSEAMLIVCGDFNNARCRGNLNEKYCKQDYIENGEELAQINYNLNIIKDEFKSDGLIMADISKNGEAIPTCKGYLPNDHIFVRNIEGIEIKKCEIKKCETIKTNLSDHDIIYAIVEI